MTKKSFFRPSCNKESLRGLFYTCLFTFCFVFSFSTQAFCGNVNQQQRFSLKVTNANIIEVFKQIQKKTGFDFFYQNDQMPAGKRVTGTFTNATVEEVLKEILKGTSLKFEIVDKDIVISLASQNGTIKGKQKVTGVVVDASGEPLPGVSVSIFGTTKGTITDVDGHYSIEVTKEGEFLVFSYIGMKKQKISVSGKTKIDVVLATDAKGLEEVVVVGYGKMKRKQITSSVTTIDASKLQKGASSNPVQLLQGKVAGLAISRPNGSDPNSSPEIMLRGMTSLGGGSPLIIVNGVQVSSLDIVSPEDIASVSVLKDGSAAAIYGSRGTNGVILITTKEGKNAEPTIEYSGYYSFDQISKRPEVLSADEYRALAQHRGIKPGEASTDWYDELIQPSGKWVHNIAISGGSQKSDYRASIEYDDHQGIALNSYKERINGRVNINHRALKDHLKVKVDLSASHSKSRAADYGAFGTALRMDPTQPVYEEDGCTFTKFPDFGKNNPVASIKQLTSDNTHKILLSNIYAELKLIEGLSVGGRIAWKIEDNNSGSFESRYSENSLEQDYQGKADRGAFFSTRSNYELISNYRKQIKKHEVSFMVNWSKESDVYEDMSMWNKGYATDAILYNNIQAGSWLSDKEKTPGMATSKKKNELESCRARLVYSYDDKYLFTASYNREGSSKFGDNYKWGDFKGLSLGWTLSKEGFMENSTICNYLKLRFGYGETGNNGAAEYQSLARIGPEGLSYLFRGQSIVAYGLKGNPNPNLRWEKKSEANLGIDYALYDNLFKGSLELYQRKTSDLLYSVDAPLPSNLNPRTLSNVGEIYNRGIEFTLATRIVNHQDFNWTSSFNISYNSNKVKRLTVGKENAPWIFKDLPSPGNLGKVFIIQKDEAIGNFYGKRFVRIDEEGRWVFKDLNKDGEIKDEDDREIIGNGTPKYFAGLTNNIRYKNFTLEFFFRGTFDYDILNVGRMYYENINKFPASNIYKTTGQNGLKEASQYSDYYLENGNYIKLENITLGYSFDVRRIGFISAARIYASCNNVFTITNYSGLSPEVGIAGIEPGYDGMSFYPVTRTFSIGTTLKF